eukprot:5366590-Pyramimonas_sp.AAC.1
MMLAWELNPSHCWEHAQNMVTGSYQNHIVEDCREVQQQRGGHVSRVPQKRVQAEGGEVRDSCDDLIDADLNDELEEKVG